MWTFRAAPARRNCAAPSDGIKRSDERCVHPRRERRNGGGRRASRSSDLAAPEFGDAVRTEGAGSGDGGRSRRLSCGPRDRRPRRAPQRGRRGVEGYALLLAAAQDRSADAGPVERHTVAFGSRATFARDDGRRQTFRIVGEDEADPRAGSISYVSPVVRALIGKGVGDRVLLGDHEIEVLAVE